MGGLSSVVKKIVKIAFNWVGCDVIRKRNSPQITLLGLLELPLDTIIDVGANTGQFARKISGFFPNARLYCFEPLPGPFRALSSWAKTQKERVITFNLAIGDKEDDVEMFLHEDHTPSSSLLATTKLTEEYYPFTKGQKRIRVKQLTLDSALKQVQSELSSKILIKLDVQGYEDRVIAGGRELFKRASACILEVGLDHLYEEQAKFTQLVLMLDDLGYSYAGNLEQSYSKDGHCIYLDALFLNKTRIKE